MRMMKPAMGLALLVTITASPALASAEPSSGIGSKIEQSAPPEAAATGGEESLGLLATPSEMIAMGEPEARVRHQAQGLELLDPSRRAEQERIREAQAQSAIELSESGSTDAAQAKAHLMPCLSGNNYYMVTWNRGSSKDCLANAGTWNASPILIHTKSVRPGNNVGRVYYPWGEYWYWSPWRGKSMTTYRFSSPISVNKVQIR